MLAQFGEGGEVDFFAFASTLHEKMADPRYNEAFGDAFDLFVTDKVRARWASRRARWLRGATRAAIAATLERPLHPALARASSSPSPRRAAKCRATSCRRACSSWARS